MEKNKLETVTQVKQDLLEVLKIQRLLGVGNLNAKSAAHENVQTPLEYGIGFARGEAKKERENERAQSHFPSRFCSLSCSDF